MKKTQKNAPKNEGKKTATLSKSPAEEIFEAICKALNLKAPNRFHLGTILELGFFKSAGGKLVTIKWQETEAEVTTIQQDINDDQWDILKLAYNRNEQIIIISDKPNLEWVNDLSCLGVFHN